MRPARADLHCHSSASGSSKLGVQRALGLPECATDPAEVYELARRRGMDFVTITDHDSIAGAHAIAHQPGAFISEELTLQFGESSCEAHLLCFGITPEDHEWLQRHRKQIARCAEYIGEQGIVCALAHPFFDVGAPLGPAELALLAQLFPIWEVRNGSRAPELNEPAAAFVATGDRIGIGGSDDHAGTDIGRTWTATPPAADVAEFLAHVRAGRARAGGAHGSAAKWADCAIALAARSVGDDRRAPAANAAGPQLLRLLGQIMREGAQRASDEATGFTSADARSLLMQWQEQMELAAGSPSSLIAMFADGSFHHDDLYRRARRLHESHLRDLCDELADSAPALLSEADGPSTGQIGELAERFFSCCMPVLPYATASLFLAGERARLRRPHRREERRRVALLLDGIATKHGVSRLVAEIRARNVPGFEVEAIGADPEVDRRLPCVAEIAVPAERDLKLGVPSVAAVAETLARGDYDIVHVCAPGPAGALGALIGHGLNIPVVGSHHTELSEYARERGLPRPMVEATKELVARFYGACDVVLSPSASADRSLRALGIESSRLTRWGRGVDCRRFNPEQRDATLFPRERFNVLFAGRLEPEKGIAMLLEAIAMARVSVEHLHLVVAGGGSLEPLVRERLGEHVTLLGWLEGKQLARAYASADLLCFPSSTDTYGQVVLEAKASGLPVLAIDRGGPRDLIEHGCDGLLCPPSAAALAAQLATAAASPTRLRQLAAVALQRARLQSWESNLERLAFIYRAALADNSTAGMLPSDSPGEEATQAPAGWLLDAGALQSSHPSAAPTGRAAGGVIDGRRAGAAGNRARRNVA